MRRAGWASKCKVCVSLLLRRVFVSNERLITASEQRDEPAMALICQGASEGNAGCMCASWVEPAVFGRYAYASLD